MKILQRILLVVILCTANFASADSFYSSIGLGTPHYFVSPKAAGMGGAGLAVVDRFALNALNPAALNIGKVTSISVDMKYEIISNILDNSEITTLQGNAAGFRFAVPLKSYLKLLTSLQPLADSRFILSDEGATEYADYSRLVRGSGGLNAANLGLQYIFSEWLAVAAQANFKFGSYNEEWKTEFFEPGYETVSDKLNTHLWGGGFHFGVLVRPVSRIGLGLVYQSGSRLRANTQNEVGITVKSRSEQVDIDYPGAYGFGASYMTNKLIFAADYYKQNWSSYALNGQTVSGFFDYTRIGGGVEYQNSRDPFAPYTSRVGLRLGAYMSEMPFTDESGRRVKEQFVTVGMGFPFFGNRGRVDFSLAVGQRGSGATSGYSENIIRIFGSVTGGELWFQRRSR